MTEKCPGCGEVLIPRPCPHCGAPNDADTVLYTEEHAHPQESDLAICLYCSGISIYTETGIRVPTTEELDSLLRNHQVRKTLVAIAQMRENGDIPPCPA